ncbi:TetR/AcrR family transcriptional regulator [Nocardioides ferulae]|uniref:TetR/AcrR family transcriptional regulator n=1 Tax=Nocardioides ferulae TaxID=2340821 RepID=UPI000EB36427|nr:TetR-like C-terminal domain-containing protein [Nocardioides ferulae]
MGRVGLNQQKLVLAAADLADAEGFEAVTMSAMARRFEVKAASLYSHVASTADLRAQIAVLALGELAERAGAAVAGRSGSDALLEFASAYRDYARLHPGRYAATRHPLPEHLLAAGRAHAELTYAVLRGYGLGGEDATHAVRLIGSVLHGFTDLELSGGFSHSAPPSQESWLRAIEALDATLTRWARA